MKSPWKVIVTRRGIEVINTRLPEPLYQRWHWRNHPEDDPRFRPHPGTWVCGKRPLIFTDYYRALRTAKRLNWHFREGAARALRDALRRAELRAKAHPL
jgi:hypothetical protein